MNISPEALGVVASIGIGIATVAVSVIMSGRRVLAAQRTDARAVGRAEGVLQTTLALMTDKITGLENKVMQIQAEISAARNHPYPCSKLEEITRVATILRDVADRLDRNEARLTHTEHGLNRLEALLAGQSGIVRGRRVADVGGADSESVLG